MNKTKILILTTVFIDVLGLGIVIPILPFYVQKFNSSPILITSLFAVYSVLSFLSAPIIGAASDKVGRKIMLITSIFSTSIGWFVFAAAPSVLFLFLGRIIDGAAAGNLPIAQAYLTDIAKSDQERTTNLGLIGAIFGIAFILGPFLGGALGSVSHTFPFWAVGVLALVNGILAIFFLPETNKNLNNKRKISINPLKPIARALKDQILLPNYLAWFLFGLAIAAFQSTFALYMNSVFGFKEFALGLIYTAMGVIIALNQIVVLKHFWLKKFREPDLELVMLILFIIGFLLLTFRFWPFLILGLLATTFGQSVLRVVMNSQMVSKADPRRKGEILGIISSITSLSMSIGPFIAGWLFTIQNRLPFIGAAFCLGLACYVLYQNRVGFRISQFDENITGSEI
jgi:DHA1 family tetracycline resistance protein-like MFS transporter